jgi:hypothetical protein
MSLTTAPSRVRRWSATIRGVFLGRVAPGGRSPTPAAALPVPASAADADGVSLKFIRMKSGVTSVVSDENTPWNENSTLPEAPGPGGGGPCEKSSTWPAAPWHVQGQKAGRAGTAEARGSAGRHMRGPSADVEAQAQYAERRPRRQSSRAATAMDGVLDGTRRQGPGRVTRYPMSIWEMTILIRSSPISLAHIPNRYAG